MSNLFIPDTILSGYKNDESTMTGLLAYLTYYKTKSKSKVYKDISWNNWRDKSIDVQEFKNEPTKGFIISQGIKKESFSYFKGKSVYERMRIHDPRGFDFDVSLSNLALILYCSNVNNGEFLDEFVYAWDQQELILLPVKTEEYILAKQNTKIQKSNVSAKNLIVGATYKTKHKNNVIYLGRFYVHNKIDLKFVDKNKEELLSKINPDFQSSFEEDSHLFLSSILPFYNSKNHHVFVKSSILEEQDFNYSNIKKHLILGKISDLSHLLTTDKAERFPELYNAFVDSQFVQQVLGFKLEQTQTFSIDDINDDSTYYFLKLHNNIYAYITGYIHFNNGHLSKEQKKISFYLSYYYYDEVRNCFYSFRNDAISNFIPYLNGYSHNFNSSYCVDTNEKFIKEELIKAFQQDYFMIDNAELVVQYKDALLKKDLSLFDEKYHNLINSFSVNDFFYTAFLFSVSTKNISHHSHNYYEEEMFNNFININKYNIYKICNIQ